MSSDGAKLLAAGVTVTLKDGVPRRLILDMEALVVIEERLGSLSDYIEGLHNSFRGKLVRSTLAGLTACLSHYRDEHGAPAFPRYRVSELMDFHSIAAYATALIDAWDEAIPRKEKGSRGKGSARARRSPGRRSTGGRRSTMADTRASSGE